MWNLKCMQCVGERKQTEQDAIEAAQKEGIKPEDVDLSKVQEEHPMRDAITMVTQWVQETAPGGMGVMATCVTLPVCYEHVAVIKRSALDLAGAAMIPRPAGSG